MHEPTPDPVLSHPSHAGVDKPRLQKAVGEILAAIGEDPGREGLKDTPRRVADAYAVLFGGLAEDPSSHLSVGFSEGFSQEVYNEMVLVRDVPLYSICEHHLIPFYGKAHIGYLPEDRLVGLSKLARVLEGYARRPQLQERLTSEVADALYEDLGSRGSVVVIECEHLCMTMRGVQKPGSVTVTRAVRGVYAEDSARRAEALALIHRGDRGF